QALRCPAAVLRDHASGACVADAQAGHEAMLDAIEAGLPGAAVLAALPAWQAPVELREDAPVRFTAGALRILDYLAAGDVFQVNPSRGWCADFVQALDPARLY